MAVITNASEVKRGNTNGKRNRTIVVKCVKPIRVKMGKHPFRIQWKQYLYFTLGDKPASISNLGEITSGGDNGDDCGDGIEH